MPADLIAAWQRFSLRWRGRVVGAVLLAAAVLGLWTTAQAAISYVAAASNASGGQVSSIVINRPAGTAANDLLVAALAQDGAGTISAPAGWVQRLASNGTRLPQLVIFTKVATGSEAASYTFTSTVSQEFAGGIMSYRGVDTTSPIDASAISANAASTSSLAPSITTTTTNTVLVAFWACADADITPPGTMTVPFNAVAGSGASSVNVAGAYQTQAAAGATGSRTAALQNSLVSNGAMLALRSAGAAITVSGTVFEDRNYGGGAGRSLATSGGSGVTGARVELYNGSGAYLQATTTAAGGGYSFSGLTASTTYYVRVVSGSVASTRTGSSGSLVGVMTYRAAANAGTAAGVADYVGGSNPALVDPGNGAGGTSFNTSSGVFSAGLSGTAQAFSQATAAVVDLTGIDFGFNFSTVVNTNDAGQGSLRQAITNANTLGGDASLAQSGRTAAVENLVFMIPNGTAAAGLRSGNNAFAGGVATIAPGSALPVLSTSMVIDAQTQPGWSASPVLQLNGSSMGGVCLAFSAGSSTLRGWIINRCTSDALSVYGGSTHIFQGNWIGLDSAGTTASAASGSSANAISLSGVSAVLIGGTSAAQRNVLSGNTYAGIYIGSTTTALAITGNYIGTNAAGTAAVANAVGGIRWASSISGTSGVTVGGTAAGQGNVISGNTGIGVRVTLGAPTLNGNIIGLNAAGTAALPNTSGGIQLLTNVNGAVIGGTSAAARNVISGNTGAGISAASGTVTNVTVQGNYIGSNAAGSAALANSGDGIDVQVGTSISIGGTAAGSGNLIMGNGGRGVNVRGSSSGISILGNSITGNGNIGIDLGNDGVTVNDGAKTAGQPNLLMDTPVITSASLSGTTLTLAGYVGSAAGQSTFASSRVEFFVSDLDASGYGEGQAYIGALTTDASGNFSGSITVPGGVTVTSGSTKLSATATDGSNNTSEFGANFALGPVISGSVFEDIHYGGGAGRTLAASGGAAVAGATVELYNSSGGYVSSTTTAGDGSYRFAGLATSSTYYVRVVSSTVLSTRSGSVAGLRAVMTYRSNASSGAAVAVTDYVGGTNPALADPAAASSGASFNTTSFVYSAGLSGTAQSVTTVTLGSSSLSGVDFGFNFDTIVNSNDAGAGSFRQVITNANALGGDAGLVQSGRSAAIENLIFMIGNGTAAAGLRSSINLFSGGVASITLASALPTLSTTMVVDAQTQAGWTLNPLIEINGSGAGSSAGLQLGGDGSILRGLIVNRFSGAGISASAGSSYTVQGCWVGLNTSGSAAAANTGSGIALAGSGSSHQIGGSSASQRNVVSGNGGYGIYLAGGGAHLVQGNYVGTNAAGNAAVGNTGRGVFFDTGVTSATLGGTAAGAGNVISGNNDYAVWLAGGATTVQGNLIGLGADGALALGNTAGLYLLSGGHQIGGSSSAARNVVSNNGGYGLWLNSAGNTVQGNYVGTNAAGSAARPNATGIYAKGINNVIGGTAVGAGNLVSGNSSNGILLDAVAGGSTVQGNVVGLNAAGTAALANAVGINVACTSGCAIGGTASGAGNTVSGNSGRGVSVSAGSSGNAILGNRIYANGSLGIDLNADGVTPNDGAKTSGQANLLMDQPVLTSARVRGDQLTAAGYVGSAAGQSLFGASRVEIFLSDNDASGYGQGKVYLGALTTDASGNFSGTLTMPVTSIPLGSKLTATATDGSNNTSEFGAQFSLLVDLVVNSNLDSADSSVGDGSCLTAGGVCTLRAAIAELNAWPALSATPTIAFAIPGCSAYGVAGCSIAPATALPSITRAVVIDATTQPGWNSSSAAPLIEINGSGVAAGISGLVLSTSNASVRGLVINRFSGNGITLGGSGNTVVGNFIGSNAAGTAAAGNGGAGVSITGGSNNVVGGSSAGSPNLINGNAIGVSIASGSGHNLQRNSIYGNTALGIDLGNDGATNNDGAYNGSQPNQGVDTPVITGAGIDAAGTSMTVYGAIGTGSGQAIFAGARVEFFKAAADATGRGQGQTYLGFLIADAAGQFSGNVSFASGALVVGDAVTATATDSAGNTSEFGPNWTSTTVAGLTPAGFNAFDTGTAAGATTGAISTRLAGAATTLDVIALNSAGTGLHPGFTGTVALTWIDARDDSGAATGTCKASWVSVASAGNAVFSNNSRVTVSLTPPAASTRVMRLKMSTTSAAGTVTACSNDAFAAIPSTLTLAATDADAATAGSTRALGNTAASGGVVHRAGRPFTITSQARDATGALMTAYDGSPALAITGCVLPAGCSAGTLTAAATSASGGVYTHNAVNYAEVGAISLQLTDTSYADVDVPDTAAGTRRFASAAVNVGRFVPDSLTATVSSSGQFATANGGCMASGQGATFIGQGFTWVSAPRVTVTARNAAGATTALWSGALMKLAPGSGNVPALAVASAGSATISTSFGAVAVTDLGGGQARLDANSTDRFVLELPAGTAQPSVTPSWTWSLAVTDASEAAVSGNPTLTTSASQASVGFNLGAVFHSARLSLSPAHGDARAGVRALVQLQRYTAAGWVTLTEDRGCVTVQPQHLGVESPQGIFTSAGACAAPFSAAATTAGGRAWLSLPATPGAAPGRLTLRLAGEAASGNSCTAGGATQALVPMGLPWLLGGVASAGPLALATWGAANRDAVLRRETW